ncbi:kinase-like domain-containing protein [Amylocarpus encephaloides]|uniref:non-specific serine/threonine protein kinase n=1 Tax=Amylocarpus encephaloides TaxID=45428 RepID=A0A9P7YBJ4_9HELO|nr:kinase-like domain-containing protein [Amylocarpus encephaloides]
MIFRYRPPEAQFIRNQQGRGAGAEYVTHSIHKHKGNPYISAFGRPEPERGSRESTISHEDDDDGDNNDLTSHAGLQLTFNSGPKAGQGFILGTDINSYDIVLLNFGKISRRHYCLTFDVERRLILRNLSQNGTIVTYNGQGGEKRRTTVTYDGKGGEKRHYFTWVLSGSEVSEVEKIVIQIQEIKFQIIVSRHETYPDLYNNNVNRFLQEANADDELPLSGLGIQKIFNMTKSQWRREARIMDQVSRLSNEHIVRLVTLIETPSPRLILEYLPCGNLEDQHKYHRFSYQESLTILCQSLDALTSVHENDIVHRDIKPANILVLSRNPLHIKLGDFGVSKATADLQTFCGTPLYAAPEIYTTRRSEYYTKACDIWSLGVIVFNYAYGPLPEFYREDEGLAWCKIIIKQVNDWDSDDLVDFLSTAMLIIKPDDRLPARECWEQALQLSAPSQSRCPTLTQASYSVSDWLQEVSDPHRATPSATPTEVATFIRMEARQNNNRSMQQTNAASSSNWLRDRNSVGSNVAALGEDVDEGRTRLPPPEAPKNLSTRSLRSDRKGLVYVVIRRHAVAMRLSDYKLNASEICNVVGLNESSRHKYLRILKRRDIVTVEKKHCWVLFQDGVFLSQALNLAKELNTLFSKAPINIPLEGGNYFLSEAPQKVGLLLKEYVIL